MQELILGMPAWAFAIFIAIIVLSIVWAIVFKPEKYKVK
jgi:uncharacterized protein involved in outer membrane biogenesis